MERKGNMYFLDDSEYFEAMKPMRGGSEKVVCRGGIARVEVVLPEEEQISLQWGRNILSSSRYYIHGHSSFEDAVKKD